VATVFHVRSGSGRAAVVGVDEDVRDDRRAVHEVLDLRREVEQAREPLRAAQRHDRLGREGEDLATGPEIEGVGIGGIPAPDARVKAVEEAVVGSHKGDFAPFSWYLAKAA
jgi:hypothetical protein